MRFKEFSLSQRTASYQNTGFLNSLKNAVASSNDFVEFTASSKMPNCKPTSFPCGKSCQPAKTKSGKATKCRNLLQGQAANYADWLKNQQVVTRATNTAAKNISEQAAEDLKASTSGFSASLLSCADLFQLRVQQAQEKIDEFNEYVAEDPDYADFMPPPPTLPVKELTEAESSALNAYTASAFRPINAYLRGDQVRLNALIPNKDKQSIPMSALEADFENAAKLIDAALDKFPNYVPPKHFNIPIPTVRRAASLSQAQLAQYQVGTVVTEKGFTSTSKYAGFSADGEEVNAKYIIYSKTGKDISAIAHRPDEHEVLFKRNTKFKVLNIELEGDLHKIYMEEYLGNQ